MFTLYIYIIFLHYIYMTTITEHLFVLQSEALLAATLGSSWRMVAAGS